MNPVHCTSQNFIRTSMAIFPWYPKNFTAMAAFRAGEASWLMMCWATTEATPFVELSFSWKDTILGAPMVLALLYP